MSNLTITTNGENAYKSTGNKNLDLFSTVNRDVNIHDLVIKFINAWNEDPECAIKVLLNFRDIREGKGEKNISKIMLFIIKFSHSDIYEKLLPIFIEVGCWKDLLFLYEMSLYYNIDNTTEISTIVRQLNKDINSDNISLCAKWAPTEGCHFDKKTGITKKIISHMNLTPKEYRKIITNLRNKLKLVECQLSQQKFTEITFSNIPAKAHILYKNAFLRNSNVEGIVSIERIELNKRYIKYIDSLKIGKEKANFKTIMPHEIINEIKKTKGLNIELLENQWNSIREQISKLSIFDRCVSIVDVSGSMSMFNKNPMPIDVSIALGILVAECAKGEFANKMFTFSEVPELVDINNCENLYKKINKVQNMSWGASTNLEAVFDNILRIANYFNIEEDKMPNRLFIFTDMQFNQVSGDNYNTFDKIKEKYKKNGYNMPHIICWNLASVNSVPFTQYDNNVCMLSGFSIPILKAFLTCQEITPISIFLSNIDKYNLPDIDLKPIIYSDDDLEKIVKNLENIIKKCEFKNKNVNIKKCCDNSDCSCSD